jgi:hypothetical protein
MKKSITISFTILVIILLILGGFNYLFTGQIVPSYSCGGSFNDKFTSAITSNDINSYLNISNNISYPAKDPINNGFYCLTPKVGMMSDKYLIRENDFKDSYLEAFAAATNNIEACKLIDGAGSKISCILNVKQSTGNKDYCTLITGDDLVRGKCMQ